MRVPQMLAAATAAALFVTGCSQGASSVPAAPMAGFEGSSALSQIERSSIDPALLGLAGTPRRTFTSKIRHAAFQELAVTDTGPNAVLFFNGTFGRHGNIKGGIDEPDGDFIDAAGNLYVAQYAIPNVVEYARNGTTPSFTYTDGLSDPVAVTTDAHRNVYVANYSSLGPGPVVEFPQGSNRAIQDCNSGLANTGIAVDAKGDVFVSGNTYGVGRLLEYRHGLRGCKAITLGVTLSFAGGLQIDNRGNLAACDQQVGVDIVPPPYNAIASTITGAVATFHDALTRDNSLIFIADPAGHQVLVDEYPSGVPVTTLGSTSGVIDPQGVATYPYQRRPKGR
jgi:hypothetical protein